MRPERHNSVKVLMFFDVGGSMDDHIKVCEELFSACRPSSSTRVLLLPQLRSRLGVEGQPPAPQGADLHPGRDPPLWRRLQADLRRRRDHEPYEIIHQRGAIDYANEEPGAVWLRRLLDALPRGGLAESRARAAVGVPPLIRIVRDPAGERMYPLTIDGLGRAIRQLSRSQRGS